MSEPALFKYKCNYRAITGVVCGIRCLAAEGCSKHKGRESYTQKCIFPDCTRYTRSKTLKCTDHIHRKSPALTEAYNQEMAKQAPPQPQIQSNPEPVKQEESNVDEAVQKLNEMNISNAKPKLTPAERMKIARDAKKNKKIAADHVLKAQEEEEES